MEAPKRPINSVLVDVKSVRNRFSANAILIGHYIASHVIVASYMHVVGRPKSVSHITALIFVGLFLGNAPASSQNPMPQTQSPASSKPARHDSVEIVEHLSPEEVEEGKLNDLYESVAQLQRKGTCTTEIIEHYQFEVIPPAEKSTFNVPKNKFLFLANRDIGNCYLALQKFAEAESSFQKILQYAPVWPGTNDSLIPSISAKSQWRRWASSIGQKPNNRS